MNKKKVLVLVCIAIVACTSILIIIFNFNSHKANENEIVINQVDLKTVDDLRIGSEPPKLIYADKEKVILNCCGVYVYDMKSKIVTKSFDLSSLLTEKYMKFGCFVSQDGKQIIFGVTKEPEGLVARYGYSFENDLVKELTEKEYRDYREKMFNCTDLDYNDKLYQKSTGRIINISDNEYVYLTFQDWVSTIKIVHVKDGKETYYSLFDKK